VIGPLFSKHHVLAQVAGHHVNVIKAIPPLVVSESDLEWFADALEQAIARAERIPRATLGFAARAATRV
jgi:ornithine--oxo-acid transaminase